MTRQKIYNAELDVFRFAFAMMIAWFHLTHFTGIGLNLSWFGELPLIRLIGGYMATDFFFIVSGALMACHAQKMINTPMVPSEPLMCCFHKYKGTLSVFITSLLAALLLDKLVVGADLLHRSGTRLDAVWEVLCLHMSGAGNGYLISDPDWFLSALLLGSLVVYPVVRLKPDITMNYIAPLASVLLFGYLIKTYGHLCVNFATFNLVYPALIRSVAGLLLGTFVWQCAQKVSAISLTAFGRWSVTVLELVCFASVWVLTSRAGFSRNDMISMLFLAGLCILVLSGQSALAPHLNQKFSRFLSDMSRAVFFSHYIVYMYFQKNQLSTPNRTFVAFTVCVIILALTVLAVSKLATHLLSIATPKLKKLFVEQELK